MSTRLVYWQHYVEHEDEFDSFDDALHRATFLEAYGEGAPERIIDGKQIVEGDELSELIYDLERRAYG